MIDIVLHGKTLHQQPMVSLRASDHSLLYRKHAVHSHALPQSTQVIVRPRRPAMQQDIIVNNTPYLSTDIVNKRVTVALAHTQVDSEDRSYDIDDVFVKIATIEAENPVQEVIRRFKAHRAM